MSFRYNNQPMDKLTTLFNIVEKSSPKAVDGFDLASIMVKHEFFWLCLIVLVEKRKNMEKNRSIVKKITNKFKYIFHLDDTLFDRLLQYTINHDAYTSNVIDSAAIVFIEYKQIQLNGDKVVSTRLGLPRPKVDIALKYNGNNTTYRALKKSIRSNLKDDSAEDDARAVFVTNISTIIHSDSKEHKYGDLLKGIKALLDDNNAKTVQHTINNYIEGIYNIVSTSRQNNNMDDNFKQNGTIRLLGVYNKMVSRRDKALVKRNESVAKEIVDRYNQRLSASEGSYKYYIEFAKISNIQKIYGINILGKNNDNNISDLKNIISAIKSSSDTEIQESIDSLYFLSNGTQISQWVEKIKPQSLSTGLKTLGDSWDDDSDDDDDANVNDVDVNDVDVNDNNYWDENKGYLIYYIVDRLLPSSDERYDRLTETQFAEMGEYEEKMREDYTSVEKEVMVQVDAQLEKENPKLNLLIGGKVYKCRKSSAIKAGVPTNMILNK